jgi:hypothetical protein
VKRRVAPKALEKLKERVRELTSQVVRRLRSYLVGWKSYFRLADTPGVLRDVDKWLHRRLRMLILKQNKRGTTLYRTLRARGLSDRLARAAAAHCGRWWAMATHGALKTAFPTQYFLSLGVPRLGPHNLNSPNRRMRTRMSGGVGGEQESYSLLLPIPIHPSASSEPPSASR